MTNKVGRGFLGSLRARVRTELRELYRDNKVLRNARHGAMDRALRRIVAGRSVPQLLVLYFIPLVLATSGEWWLNAYAPCFLPGWQGSELRGFLKDFCGFLITGQVGVLAIVALAVGVVTLLSQRNDGASATTNIRLYYSESYAYEVATSGVTLLLVLAVQLFWPLQSALHGFGLGGSDLAPKVFLTAFHALWFGFNLILFLRFMVTSFHFVEPEARAAMRQQYTASIGIPHDLGDRLARHLYMNSPAELFGPDELKKGPDINVGHSPFTGEEALVEVQRRFQRPSALHDVRFRLLELALRSWIKRVRKTPAQQPKAFDTRQWAGALTFPAAWGGNPTESVKLALRQEGVELRSWERLLVSASFSFHRPRRVVSRVATPADFLEDLVSELITNIEKPAFSAFKTALREALEYHRFLLESLNTRDTNGEPFNFAEIGGMWQRPDQDWAHEYRRVFAAAADKLGDNPEFMEWLTGIESTLFPEDATAFSSRVLRTIVEIGIYQVIALEAWLTERTLPTYDPERGSLDRLAANDQSAYQRVLIQVVGSWETLEQRILIAFRLRRRTGEPPTKQWQTLRRAWPGIDAHLRVTSFYIASAVWNEDEAGAERYRDVLLRWLNPFYDFLGHDYQFRNRFLLTPDLLDSEWDVARSAVEALASYQVDGLPKPNTAFGLILRGVHEDVFTITAAVCLSWYGRDQQATDIGGRTAAQLMRRQVLDEGSDLTAGIARPRSAFRIVFDFLLRQALYPRFGDSSYSAALNELVRFIAGVASKRMVPGRVYSGWGLEGVDTLRPALLAILAASLPAEGDEGALRVVSELLVEGAPLSNVEAARRFGYDIDALINVLGEAPDEVFARSFGAFGDPADSAAAHGQLRELLQGIKSAVQAHQQQRLANALPDPEKVAAARRMITDKLLADGPDIHCFQNYALARGGRSDPVQQTRFGVVDRGAFATPHMSAISFEEYARILVEMSQQHLAQYVWRDLFRRDRESIEVDIAHGLRHFWRSVIARAHTNVAEPTILVPYDNFGEGVGLASHGLPNSPLDEFQVTRNPGLSGGGGTAYLGTIEGVHVFSADVKRGTALMFSGVALRSIEYGIVAGHEDVADFSFEEAANPAESWVQLRFAQSTKWDESSVVEFRFDPEKLPKEGG